MMPRGICRNSLKIKLRLRRIWGCGGGCFGIVVEESRVVSRYVRVHILGDMIMSNMGCHSGHQCVR